jgi:E-phenylitaconyl-CoA hydratase
VGTTPDLGVPLDGLLYEITDGIAVITLNRPERGNALNGAMSRALHAAWTDVRENPEVKVAVLTGAGTRHFCTGADMSAVAESGRVSPGGGPMTEEIFVSAWNNRVWKPVICAVNGLVAGAGLHLVAESDVVIAAEHAGFTDTHVNVGMVAGFEAVALARRLPLGAALRLSLFGKSYRMTAQRAHELGLVDELTSADSLAGLADEMARQLLQNSPEAMALTKQVLWSSLEVGYRQAAEQAWAMIRMHWQHPDFAEGPRAFAERRPPRWSAG